MLLRSGHMEARSLLYLNQGSTVLPERQGEGREWGRKPRVVHGAVLAEVAPVEEPLAPVQLVRHRGPVYFHGRREDDQVEPLVDLQTPLLTECPQRLRWAVQC